jgi:hypothetical protein
MATAQTNELPAATRARSLARKYDDGAVALNRLAGALMAQLVVEFPHMTEGELGTIIDLVIAKGEVT